MANHFLPILSVLARPAVLAFLCATFFARRRMEPARAQRAHGGASRPSHSGI